MKTAAFIAFLSLSIALPSYVYADDHKEMSETEEERVLSEKEAKELIMSTPEADDAVTGTVPDTKVKSYYDIRARQLAYRESVKDYRASLEARRKSYATPQTAASENYRETIAKLYESETKAEADKRANLEKSDEVKAKMRAKLDEVRKKKADGVSDPEVSDDQVAVSDVMNADVVDGTGLTEKPIPTDGEVVDGEPKKKVVTSEDAPDFDPSNL